MNAHSHTYRALTVDTSAEMISMAEFLTQHISAVHKPFRWLVNTQHPSTTTKMISSKIKLASAKSKSFYETQARKVKDAVVNFRRVNAEDTKLPNGSVDLVTIMYAFHEIPRWGRDKILNEAYRLLRPGGTLAIVDISADYEPSETMLMGEPYVLEYQKNIHFQLDTAKGFRKSFSRSVVPGHVQMWVLQRT
jgi:ubiquinone/menaquinone biosynthesis C-methylase UbiE